MILRSLVNTGRVHMLVILVPSVLSAADAWRLHIPAVLTFSRTVIPTVLWKCLPLINNLLFVLKVKRQQQIKQ